MIKFLKSMGQLSKGIGEDRLRFIYSMFDMDDDKFIEKEEMLNVFFFFYEAMNQVEFENNDLNLLKNKIGESSEQQIMLSIQDIVNEIYDNFQTKSGILVYDGWKTWIEEDVGLKYILDNSEIPEQN